MQAAIGLRGEAAGDEIEDDDDGGEVDEHGGIDSRPGAEGGRWFVEDGLVFRSHLGFRGVI
jgi:hypothetical protein